MFECLNVLLCNHLPKSKFDPHTGPQNHWLIYIGDMKKVNVVCYYIHMPNILYILTFAPAFCLSGLLQQYAPHLLFVFVTQFNFGLIWTASSSEWEMLLHRKEDHAFCVAKFLTPLSFLPPPGQLQWFYHRGWRALPSGIGCVSWVNAVIPVYAASFYKISVIYVSLTYINSWQM